MSIIQKIHVQRLLSVILATLMICSVMGELMLPASSTEVNLVNPITGTVQGAGYDESAGHNGIDLYPYNYGDPVYAVASGTLMYSCERNHTSVYKVGDNCCSVKIILDKPITHNGMTYVCAFYTHMSSLVYDVYCGYNKSCVTEYNAGLRANALPTESIHVNAGDIIGYVGKGNGATHLHLSFEASEADGYKMMPNSGYYDVFGWEYNEKITAGGTTSDANVFASTYSTGLTLAQLKSKYPEGRYWNGGDADKHTAYACTCHNQGICINDIDPCNCNHFQGGTQCNGFARKIAYDAYGTHVSTWQTTSSKSYVESLKPGDVVYNDSPHWFMVISVSADSVIVGECNWGSRCVIKWSRSVKKSTIKAYSGLNIYIAPYSLPGGFDEVDTCTCSTSYVGTYTCITSSAPLLIRSGHGTNYGDIGSIPSGATVSVSKANGSWAHVTYNGVSGYASMEYLARVEPTAGGYPLPLKTVTLASGSTAARALYSDGTPRGWIYGTDECTIKEIYSSGLCLLNCEYNGSYQDVYARISDFLCSTATPTQMNIERKATTYYRSTGSEVRGWVDPGDKVYVVGTSGSRTQIIYPHTDGTHRCAWVDTSALYHTHTPGAAATCVTPQVCTSCDALLVNAYGHSAGAAATCTTSQTCTRAGCGEVLTKNFGHAPGAAATCTTPQSCTRCGTTIANALGHAPGSAATCTAPQSCTRCGTTIANALGHNPGAAATCTAPQICTRCGTIVTPAKGHSYTAGDFTDPTHPHTIYHTCSCGAMQDSGMKATFSRCEICNPSVTGIKIDKSSLTLKTGETSVLSATITPSNATNQSVIWSSSDSSVASVNNGVVTAHKAGFATIYAKTADGGYEAKCSVTVLGQQPAEDADIIVSLGQISGRPGDTIDIELRIESESIANSYAFYYFTYNKDVLTFIDFIEHEAIEEKCIFPGGFDASTEAITLALSKREALNGTICKLRFKINENAEDGKYDISFTSLVKDTSKVIPSLAEEGSITVMRQLLGDITGNNIVDIEDALKLFQHTMIPDLYPISYIGNIDFNKDGDVNIEDALSLFRYSMIPDLYPIS